MLTKFIAKNIQEKMKAKERALARKNNPSQEADTNNKKGYLSISDMASRTCFIRMASNKIEEQHNRLIEGGLHTVDGKKQFGFQEGSVSQDSISSAYKENVFDDQIRPVPGIKSVEVSYKGGFKAIRECTVNWSVNGIEQLDDLTPHFFTLGKTVVVDWGWIYPNTSEQAQLSDTFIIRKPNDQPNGYTTQIKQEIFTNPQSIILSKDGDYDAIGGQVTNFEYNLREDGGFDCVTKIMSVGVALFKKPIDVGGNQAGISISSEDAERTPPDSLINCMLNLRDIIVYDVFNINETKVKVDGVSVGLDDSLRMREVKNLKLEQRKKLAKGPLYEKYGIWKGPNEVSDKPTVIAVDNKKNANVVWTARGNQKEDIFVTWGWMEDNIINRYASFQGGDDKSIKLTMRSIETILDADQKPIEYDNEKLKDTIDNNRDMESGEVTQPNKFFKKSTLIRNPPGLIPVNPFTFFMADISSQGINENFVSTDSKWTFNNYYIPTLSTSSENVNLNGFYKSFTTLTGITDAMKRFSLGKSGFGKLRNIYVNIKEIQKAFGITNPDSNDTSNSNISPPGTLETALNNLLSSLNSNFHNIWDFEISLDTYDSTNIKIIDKSDAEVKNPKYTKYKDGTVVDTHKVASDGLGIFQFPSYKVGSFVKNQSLTFKIPDAQALTIMYGSNKKTGEGEAEFANGQLDKLFNENKSDDFKDKFLEGIKPSNKNSAGDDGAIAMNIGSENVNPNSKIFIGENFGVSIDVGAHDTQGWWRQWTPDVDSSSNTDGTGDTNKSSKQKGFYFVEAGNNGEPLVKYKVGTTITTPVIYDVDGNTEELRINSKAQYVLNSYLNASSPIAQFDMSNLIPADLGLSIDGIGGILPFDIMHTEYIQDKYKSELTSKSNVKEDKNEELKVIGPLTYFQIFEVNQKIEPSGWTTDITAKMRINKIPREASITIGTIPKKKRKRPVVTKPQYQYTEPGVELSDTETDVVATAAQAQTETEEQTWRVPADSSTLPAAQAELAKETTPPSENQPWVGPKVINNGKPPDIPMIDIGPLLSEEQFENVVLNKGNLLSGNDTDINEELLTTTTPKPDPKIKPVTPSVKIRKSNTYKTSYDSLLEQIVTTQKVIGCGSPNTPAAKDIYPTTVGEVKKAQLFDNTVEVNMTEDPTLVVEKINEEIKKELPKEIIVDTIPKEAMIEVKSTYKFTYDQNQILYSLREDLRPLYKKEDGSLTGARFTGKGDDRVENTIVRKSVSKKIRQAFWDTYIEEPTESGKTKATKNTLYSGTPIPANLLRTQRGVYWYDEYNPDPNY
jgi:hypothetical protein